jgi:hypothetical protein
MHGIALLGKIGTDLNQGIYPVVHDRGIVEPGQSNNREEESGEKGILYESKGTRGSTAGPGEGTTGGTWSSGRSPASESWSTSSATSVVSEQRLSDEAAANLEGVIQAYPQVKLWFTPDLVWLLNWITPIRDLEESALLVTAYPGDERYNIMSWAWWGPGILWIGPRHTNYPDGSICSFEPRDGTWSRKERLTNLLDLHVLWIVRHLFMRYLGYWPGRQIFHTAYERLNEHRPAEMCGGCDSKLRYEDCCRRSDEKVDPIRRVAAFVTNFPNGERKPPNLVAEFVYGHRKTPPYLKELASELTSGGSPRS